MVTTSGTAWRAPATVGEWREHWRATKRATEERREQERAQHDVLYTAIFGCVRACVSEQHEAIDASGAPFAKELSEEGREVAEALEYFEDYPEERRETGDEQLALTHVEGEGEEEVACEELGESEDEGSEGAQSTDRQDEEGSGISDWEGSDEEGDEEDMLGWIVWDGSKE